MDRTGQFLGQNLVYRPLTLNARLPVEMDRCHSETEMTLAAITQHPIARNSDIVR